MAAGTFTLIHVERWFGWKQLYDNKTTHLSFLFACECHRTDNPIHTTYDYCYCRCCRFHSRITRFASTFKAVAISFYFHQWCFFSHTHFYSTYLFHSLSFVYARTHLYTFIHIRYTTDAPLYISHFFFLSFGYGKLGSYIEKNLEHFSAVRSVEEKKTGRGLQRNIELTSVETEAARRKSAEET